MKTEHQSKNSSKFKPETAEAKGSTESQHTQSSNSVEVGIPEEDIMSPSLDAMSSEQLAIDLVAGREEVSLWLQKAIILRDRFERLRNSKNKKATIYGCRTWQEFCEKHLHYTPRHIRRLMEDNNPASQKYDGSASSQTRNHLEAVRNAHPEFSGSNRELLRYDFKKRHPEYEGKPNKVVDKAVQQEISRNNVPRLLTKAIAAPYSEELRPDLQEAVYYGEMDEDYAMSFQRGQERGIGVVGAGNRSHGHGLKRLREKSEGIRVRHSIQAEGSGSYSFIVTIRGLREREVIPLLKFQEEQRWGDESKRDTRIVRDEKTQTPPQPKPTQIKPRRRKKERSPAGMVHVNELPLHVREKVMAQIEQTVVN